MIITCEACNASFNLDESLIKQTGSKVRCSKCRNVFVAYPTVLSAEADEPLDEMPDTQTKPEDFSADTDEKDQIGIDDTDLTEEETDSDEAHDIEEDTGEIEELGFDLGMGIDEVTEAEEGPEEDEAGIDLEDIGDIELEGAEEEPELEAEPELEEEGAGKPEDLDLELEGVEEEPELDVEPDLEVEGEEALGDLDIGLEIEGAPEAEEGPEELEAGIDLEDIGELELEGAEEEPELEAEPELEEEGAEEPEDLDSEMDLEETGDLDLSDMDGMLEVETPSESEGMEEGEIEDLESEYDTEEGEEPLGADLSEDDSAIELYEVDEITDETDKIVDAAEKKEDELEESFSMGAEESEGAPDADAGIEEDVDSPPAGKKRISTPILVLLVVIFLAGGGYGVYAVLNSMGIGIPFLSSLTKPEDKDPAGNLKIDTFDITSKFIDNTKSGKIFVITGQVKNEYEETRGFISMTASIYKKGKVLEKTETVFCGNYLSDLDLENTEPDVIKKRLSNRIGDNRSNMRIQPGQKLPFMVIFSDLPDNLKVLEEFTVVVAGSLKV